MKSNKVFIEMLESHNALQHISFACVVLVVIKSLLHIEAS